MTSRIAALALTTAFFFLIVVAIMLNSAALFYMGTALIVTVGASRLQAWLSVRALRFDRVTPERASIGETVTVEIVVWSEKRIRRPLILIEDKLPSRLVISNRTPSLPIAPAFDVPIRTQYRFTVLRRGRFKWSDLTVVGTDALGLISIEYDYQLEPVEMTVLPVPIPIEVALPTVTGWGAAEAENGLSRGAGLEPRGVRDYQSGDSMRFVHWRSTARAGKLLVKEFETGSFGAVAFYMQRTIGSDFGTGVDTTFELMCGHVAYLAERLIRQGAQVELPALSKAHTSSSAADQIEKVYEALAETEADRPNKLSDDLLATSNSLLPGTLVYVLLSIEDPNLADAIRSLHSKGLTIVALLYNPTEFDATAKSVPATAGDVIESLRSAGARIVTIARQVPL